jgi:hypothetical protein
MKDPLFEVLLGDEVFPFLQNNLVPFSKPSFTCVEAATKEESCRRHSQSLTWCCVTFLVVSKVQNNIHNQRLYTIANRITKTCRKVRFVRCTWCCIYSVTAHAYVAEGFNHDQREDVLPFLVGLE